MIPVIQIVELCSEKIKSLEQMIPIKKYELRLAEIDHSINSKTIWSDQSKAASLMKERNKINVLLSKLLDFKEKTLFYQECLTLFPSELNSEEAHLRSLLEKMSELETEQMLQGESDDCPAILTINAGAGGLEAANWVSMLLRMYLRYLESYKFETEILDFKPSNEHSSICTDAVSIRVSGKYAYGLLKSESGIHRLIRNSPFNAGDARHTSFAAVSVMPDIEDTIDIKIEDKDIEITSQTAGGPGGQNQNRIKSAIRLKHIPSGINILVRTERDQLSNKKTAFKMLKAKLYNIELEKRKEETEKTLSSQSNISFGHQIRTYYLDPYTLVKDHRTGLENNNTNYILDGNIQEFIISYLQWDANNGLSL